MINKLAMVVALDEAGGMSKNYQIPWRDKPFYKQDMARFKKLTNGHVVMMGRHTYEEIHEIKMGRGLRQDGPLLWGRTSVVLSRNPEFTPFGAYKANSFMGIQSVPEARIEDPKVVQTLFVLGGQKLFIETLTRVSDVYCTIVKGYYNCDKNFPIEYLKNFKIVDGEKTDDTYFVHYVRS